MTQALSEFDSRTDPNGPLQVTVTPDSQNDILAYKKDGAELVGKVALFISQTIDQALAANGVGVPARAAHSVLYEGLTAPIKFSMEYKKQINDGQSEIVATVVSGVHIGTSFTAATAGAAYAAALVGIGGAAAPVVLVTAAAFGGAWAMSFLYDKYIADESKKAIADTIRNNTHADSTYPTRVRLFR